MQTQQTITSNPAVSTNHPVSHPYHPLDQSRIIPGTVIWRPIFAGESKAIFATYPDDTPIFKPTERGNWSCILSNHTYCLPLNMREVCPMDRKVAEYSKEVGVGAVKQTPLRRNSGVVCFVDDITTCPNWTHLKIGAQADKCVFGLPVRLCSLKRYLDFRYELVRVYCDTPTADSHVHVSINAFMHVLINAFMDEISETLKRESERLVEFRKQRSRERKMKNARPR